MLWVASVDMPHFDAGISKWGMTPMCRTACPRPGMNGATP
jgi:hypothetical protein